MCLHVDQDSDADVVTGQSWRLQCFRCSGLEALIDAIDYQNSGSHTFRVELICQFSPSDEPSDVPSQRACEQAPGTRDTEFIEQQIPVRLKGGKPA